MLLTGSDHLQVIKEVDIKNCLKSNPKKRELHSERNRNGLTTSKLRSILGKADRKLNLKRRTSKTVEVR